MRYRLLFAVLCAAMAITLGSTAYAHDGNIYFTFEDLLEQSVDHNEPVPDGPFKGYAFVYVTNSTGLAWTDFHFAINNGPGVTIEPDPAPTMSKPVFTWSIGGVQNTLDYYFPSNPVLPGEGVTFTFYTDNTANQNALFGICGYPTIPEPTSLLALASGLGMGGLLLRKRR